MRNICTISQTIIEWVKNKDIKDIYTWNVNWYIDILAERISYQHNISLDNPKIGISF